MSATPEFAENIETSVFDTKDGWSISYERPTPAGGGNETLGYVDFNRLEDKYLVQTFNTYNNGTRRRWFETFERAELAMARHCASS